MILAPRHFQRMPHWSGCSYGPLYLCYTSDFEAIQVLVKVFGNQVSESTMFFLHILVCTSGETQTVLSLPGCSPHGRPFGTLSVQTQYVCHGCHGTVTDRMQALSLWECFFYYLIHYQ